MLPSAGQLDDFALLCLQVEWGADEAIGLEPTDRLLPVATPRQAPGSAMLPSARMGSSSGAASKGGVSGAAFVSTQPRGTAAERALAAAGAAGTLEELRAELASFDGCALRATASNLVFAEGAPSARVLIVGEPPGRDEDRSGHPFAGAEGELLDRMLASINLQRSELMLTHVLPWRPPGGRPANPSELAVCLPFLHRLVALVRPACLLLMGGTPRRALLPQAPARRKAPPAWTDIAIPGLPTPPQALVLPALGELIKTPALKRDAWEGLKLLRQTLDSGLT